MYCGKKWVAVKEDVVERGVFGAAALFFLFSLVEMDSETMKAGECLWKPKNSKP
jgi:hypothetical protein